MVATRQHHLKHLLPHMFSHPVVPANNRPRARPPPRGTFLWPTPPPLVHPLPHREYHTPSEASTSKLPDPADGPNDDTSNQPGTAAEGAGQIKRKYGRNKGKAKGKADGNEAPAHDIECLARVTLSIGPISFPDTELWVGRFVQPRAAIPKPPKAKKEKTERKRGNAVDGPTPSYKRPKTQTTIPLNPRPLQYPSHPGMAGPSSYRPGMRPPGPPYPCQPGPSGVPRPPAPPRAELSPDLIRRVNEAATKHPWLSQIIHKAARTQATKEELAKLGRVVNRLKEGKDVGEGPEDPASFISRPPGMMPGRPPTQAGPSSAPQPSMVRIPPPMPAPTNLSDAPQSDTLAVPAADPDLSSAVSNSSGPLTPPPEEDESDDDSVVDMSGPRQVGGGPGGVDPMTMKSENAELSADTPIPTSSNAVAGTDRDPLHPTGPAPSPYPVMPPYRPVDSSSFSAPSHYRPPYSPAGRPIPQFRPPQPYSNVSPALQSPSTSPFPQPAPPPPPRPTYPLPPPFLLVAFKEAPTEKFLLPLGSLSYISRRGGELDISPVKSRTPPPDVQLPSLPAPDPINVIPEPAAPIKSRTRASLGRNAKPPTPEPAAPHINPEPTVEEPPIPEKPKPLRSHLRPLPGNEPTDGTVLISTFLPAGEWEKPDWKALSTLLPFDKPHSEHKSRESSAVKLEPSAQGPDSSVSNMSGANEPAHPNTTTTVTQDSPGPLPVRGKLLNLGAESFLPAEGEVHPVTIRLGDVSDAVWQRIKTISGMVSTAEMKSLGEQEPGLMSTPEAKDFVPLLRSDSSLPTAPPHNELAQPSVPHFPPVARQPFQASVELRESYSLRKRNLFRHLLTRVPSRNFLRFRLSSPRPDIIEATTDKWAPRPYPISTKALYTREEEGSDELLLLSPELQPKKGSKKIPEPTVTFEMPISLDQLDERVAESAAKGKKLKGEDGRKRHGKRWVPGTVCEGCGDSGKRVWRAGPGGKGTCKSSIG